MSIETFTPGPWKLGEVVQGKYVKTNLRQVRSTAPHAGIDHGAICEVYGSKDGSEAAANACLIIAAPDLHAALIVQMDATRYGYAWHKRDCAQTIAEIEAKYPFLVDGEPRGCDARIHMLHEHAMRLSVAAMRIVAAPTPEEPTNDR